MLCSSKNQRYSVIMTIGTDVSDSEEWFGFSSTDVASLRAGRDFEKMESAFVLYMEITPHLDEVDWTSGCVSVIWSTSDEKVYAFTNDGPAKIWRKLKSST